MVSGRDTVIAEGMKLSADDRAVVIHELTRSLHDPVDPEVEAAWATEIERRIDAYDRGELKALDAQQVFSDIERKLKL